jgi:ABC-type multidrug transport system fused ATPase/permease subunit
VVLVTHLIGFLHDCDEVFVLEDGECVARGTPVALKAILNELSVSLNEMDDE